jgi:hypothetical protein
MSTQRIIQLVVAIGILIAIALVSERSRVAASILSVMPFNITIALWFVYSAVDGNPSLTAGFSRMVLLGLIPTALFVVACWIGLRHGWPLWQVLIVGYIVWIAAMGTYRIIDTHLVSG